MNNNHCIWHHHQPIIPRQPHQYPIITVFMASPSITTIERPSLDLITNYIRLHHYYHRHHRFEHGWLHHHLKITKWRWTHQHHYFLWYRIQSVLAVPHSVPKEKLHRFLVGPVRFKNGTYFPEGKNVSCITISTKCVAMPTGQNIKAHWITCWHCIHFRQIFYLQ